MGQSALNYSENTYFSNIFQSRNQKAGLHSASDLLYFDIE